MKAKLFPLSLALLLSLSACSGAAAPSPDPKRAEWEVFLQTVNARRRSAIEEISPMDLSPWTMERSTLFFSREELEALLTPHDALPDCSLPSLLEDAETAFALLQSSYGAYDYFGGDAVFLPLLEEIKARLSAAEAPDAALLADLLHAVLSPVVRDGHFTVDGQALIASYKQTMYYVPDLYFDSIDGLDAGLLKPTVAEDGRIAYGFVALTADPDTLPKTALVNGTDLPLTWKAASPVGYNTSNPYCQTELEGLPVLRSRAMFGTTSKAKAQLSRFAASGSDWAEYPVFVFDVRSNPGGSDQYIMEWFEGFAGHPARPKRAFAQKYSALALLAFGLDAPPETTWETSVSDGEFTENDTLIFLLQDGCTASSGETAVQLLRSMDNVLVLGSPTGGCALVPNNLTVYLPNTGLSLYFGTGLSFTETMENRDGTGFLPDLWVDPAEAESAVLRLCTYYNLNRK